MPLQFFANFLITRPDKQTFNDELDLLNNKKLFKPNLFIVNW